MNFDVKFDNCPLHFSAKFIEDDSSFDGFGQDLQQYSLHTVSVSCFTGIVEEVHRLDSKFMAQGVLDAISEIKSNRVGYRGTGLQSEVFNYTTQNKASGDYSHAEGKYTTAIGSAAHAEGRDTTASGDYSHAEGEYAVAIGYASHAEGAAVWARAYASHAEGSNSEAKGNSSHAEGVNTIAAGAYQHVQGKHNVVDPEHDENNANKLGKYAHIVGNGTSKTDRSNAHTLDWFGLGWFAGGLKVGGTGQDDENAVAVLTAADMDTIAQNVIAKLPIYNGEVESV